MGALCNAKGFRLNQYFKISEFELTEGLLYSAFGTKATQQYPVGSLRRCDLRGAPHTQVLPPMRIIFYPEVNTK